MLNAAHLCVPIHWKSTFPPTTKEWLLWVKRITETEEMIHVAQDCTETCVAIWYNWIQYLHSPEYISALRGWQLLFFQQSIFCLSSYLQPLLIFPNLEPLVTDFGLFLDYVSGSPYLLYFFIGPQPAQFLVGQSWGPECGTYCSHIDLHYQGLWWRLVVLRPCTQESPLYLLQISVCVLSCW